MTYSIHVAKEFSKTPGGRYREDGPHSGEEFREDVLIPMLKVHDKLDIFLDGARGYPSSFLDEAFAGLVRKLNWTYDEFNLRIFIHTGLGFSIYKKDILNYVRQTETTP